MGGQVNIGLIKLIPTRTRKHMVGGWRPVTLLNVSYKVLANALANKIKIMAVKNVWHDQAEFIEGKRILVNPIMVKGRIELAMENGQKVFY